MIVIAYNYENKIISIVNSKSVELANAFWQGKGLVPFRIATLEKDFTPLEDHVTGIYEVLKTKTVYDGRREIVVVEG